MSKLPKAENNEPVAQRSIADFHFYHSYAQRFSVGLNKQHGSC